MTDNFYLDVFNHLLKFNNEEIFIIFDSNGTLWLKYSDVLKYIIMQIIYYNNSNNVRMDYSSNQPIFK